MNKPEWRAKYQEMKTVDETAAMAGVVRLIGSKVATWEANARKVRTELCPDCTGWASDAFKKCSDDQKFDDELLDGVPVCKLYQLKSKWADEHHRREVRGDRLKRAGFTNEALTDIVVRARTMLDALPKLPHLTPDEQALYLKAPRAVLAAAVAFVEGRGTHLTLCGDKGTWKTTAAACVVAETAGALWLPMSKVQPSNAFDELRERAARSKLLVVSDLGTETQTEAHRSILSGLLAERDDDGKPMLITTNLSRAQIEERYGDRVLDRLNRGVIHEAVGLSLREALR